MSSAKKNASSASLGGFAAGLIIGLLLGLALALGVALYIAKVPIPFVDKLPQRTAEQDKAEAERNKTWDPNAALTPNPQPLPASASAAPATPATPATPTTAATVAGESPGTPASTTAVPASAAAASTRDPAAILADDAKSTDAASAAFTYLVQVGAFTRTQDAEARRAALAMQGFTAKVQEREQAGRTVYRVRLGPFDTKAEADALQLKLQGAGIEGQLVRIQKP